MKRFYNVSVRLKPRGTAGCRLHSTKRKRQNEPRVVSEISIRNMNTFLSVNFALLALIVFWVLMTFRKQKTHSRTRFSARRP